MMKHLPTLLALCALTAFTATALAETPKQPNIVLLISDDDDYEHFGFMGSTRYFYLDRLMLTVTGIDKKLAIRAPSSRDTLG